MLKFICPLICVQDMARSRHFYENILKQEVLHDFGENVEFHGGFAIHLNTHFQELLGEPANYPMTFRTNNYELYFQTDDLEIMHERLVNNSVEFIHKIYEHPWGQRAMRFYDPDGHIIEIGEPMEIVVKRYYDQGLIMDEICKKTSMPQDFVKQVIKDMKSEY
jgi:catechol 2,3-dioxygenase-like lactoylglutathione lyase family enzyme